MPSHRGRLLLVLLAAALCAAATSGCGETAGRAASPATSSQVTTVPPSASPATQPATAPAAPPAASRPPSGPPAIVVPRGWHLLVALRGPIALRSRPGGRVLARLARTTAFRSPTVLPVLRRRAGWYAVLSSALPNGRVGWVSARAALEPYITDYRIDVSLRRRRVVVREGNGVVASFPVAVGAPGTPTPTGSFAVTDKLLTSDPGGPYGCCILALSGHQLHTPQGWGGGDRIAIHATDAPSSIGQAASLGCLRAPTWAMRRIVRLVPLGTVVTIRA